MAKYGGGLEMIQKKKESHKKTTGVTPREFKSHPRRIYLYKKHSFRFLAKKIESKDEFINKEVNDYKKIKQKNVLKEEIFEIKY